MQGGVLPHINVDRKPVAGDKAPGGRQQHREVDVAPLGIGQQHAKRIVLIEMRQPRRTAAPGKPDLGDACDIGAAIPLWVRPICARRTYRGLAAVFFAMMWKMCQCFGSPSFVVPG